MKICVAGQGAFGQKHLDALKRIPGVEVTSLVGGNQDSTAQVAKKYDKTIIEIAGHTDNVGGADFNKQLSQRRASAVAQYLMSKGVVEPRIMTAGGGEEHPSASNSTEQGRAANRRVEVTLAPLQEG